MKISELAIGVVLYTQLSSDILAVLVRREDGWTVYVGAVDGECHAREWQEVRSHGTKQNETVAKAIATSLFHPGFDCDLPYALVTIESQENARKLGTMCGFHRSYGFSLPWTQTLHRSNIMSHKHQFTDTTEIKHLITDGMTVKKIAEAFGLTEGAIQKWLKDDRAPYWTICACRALEKKKKNGKILMVCTIPRKSADIIAIIIKAHGGKGYVIEE